MPKLPDHFVKLRSQLEQFRPLLDIHMRARDYEKEFFGGNSTTPQSAPHPGLHPPIETRVTPNIPKQNQVKDVDAGIWHIRPQKHMYGYAQALLRALQHFQQINAHRLPTARMVLEFLRENVEKNPQAWPDIYQVKADDLAFYDSRGDVALVSMEGIRKAIGRYTVR